MRQLPEGLLLLEFFQGPQRRGFRGLGLLHPSLPGAVIGTSAELRDQLVDGDIPGDMTDRHHGGFLARIQLHDAAGSIVSQAGNDDAVAGLEPRPGLDELLIAAGLALEVGKPLTECLARALGLGLGGKGSLPCFLGFLAQLARRAPIPPA